MSLRGHEPAKSSPPSRVRQITAASLRRTPSSSSSRAAGRRATDPAGPDRGRAVRRAPPRGALEGVPGRAPGDPGRRVQGPQQRHRLPVPPALGVRPPDRPRHRPRAGRRAGAGARRDDARTGERGHEAILYFRPRAERDSQGVLRRRAVRRVLGRRPAEPGRGGGRARRSAPATSTSCADAVSKDLGAVRRARRPRRRPRPGRG